MWLQVSSGGLVSALKGVSTYETLWVGWPGACHGAQHQGQLVVVDGASAPSSPCPWLHTLLTGIWVKPGADRDSLTQLLEREGYIPVWIDPTLVGGYACFVLEFLAGWQAAIVGGVADGNPHSVNCEAGDVHACPRSCVRAARLVL